MITRFFTVDVDLWSIKPISWLHFSAFANMSVVEIQKFYTVFFKKNNKF